MQNEITNNEMKSKHFKRFCDLAYGKAGIRLKPGKEALVSARVAKRMRAIGLSSHSLYLDYLEADESGEELILFLDAISTNFTSFMRESDHFDMLSALMKQWLNEGKSRIRLWSAACSSGEEPYTMAMVATEASDGYDVDTKILATDISTKVLDRARKGEYEQKAVDKLSRLYRSKFLSKQSDKNKEEPTYIVKPNIREQVIFKRLNLAHPPYPMTGPLDVVFCRNVMIYFDNAVREKLIHEIERLLKPGGYLFVGHTETLTGVKTSLKTLKPSVYIK